MCVDMMHIPTVLVYLRVQFCLFERKSERIQFTEVVVGLSSDRSLFYFHGLK